MLEAQRAGDPTAVVLNHGRIAWDVPGLGAHGPDIAVILGVRERKNWSTFDVAAEGVRPALIIEITRRPCCRSSFLPLPRPAAGRPGRSRGDGHP